LTRPHFFVPPLARDLSAKEQLLTAGWVNAIIDLKSIQAGNGADLTRVITVDK
jgi:hypothetical protein